MPRLDDVYISIDHDRDRVAANVHSGCWVGYRNGWITLTLATPAPNQYRASLELDANQARLLGLALLDHATREVA